MAVGLLGQYICISYKNDLVIVRLGQRKVISIGKAI